MSNEISAYSTGTLSRSESLLATHRVLRNTYALLGLTLLFSAGVASLSTALALPSPGVLLTLAGFFGLFFLTAKLANSGWGLVSVFALTGFMGYTLGPIINRTLAMQDGGMIVAMALGGTAVIFLPCQPGCLRPSATSASWAAS